MGRVVTKKNIGFYLTIAATFVVNGLILGHLFSNYDFLSVFRATPPPEEKHLHLNYGQPLPPFSGMTITGETIDTDFIHGKWALIFYFERYPVTDFLRYCEVLSQKYGSSGLQPVGITRVVTKELEHLLDNQPISYPVIVDSKNHLRNLLHFRYHRYGLLFVDPSGVIRLSLNRLMTPNDLRQLVERYLVGSINYEIEQDWVIKLQPGDLLPPYRLIDVKRGTRLTLQDLELISSTIIFFTAHCPSCRLPEYLHQLAMMERSASLEAQRLYFIFSRRFSLRELIDQMEDLTVTLDIYLAEEEFEVLGSPYVTRAPAWAEVIVIMTDENSRVRAIEPLDRWLAEFQKE